MFRRWLYRLEKGHPHVIMLAVLMVVIVALSFLGGVVVWALGDHTESLASSIWWTFLHLSDPGYLGDNETMVSRIFGTLFITLGLVTFVAGLVGILTSMISSTLERIREAGAPLSFRNHTIVIGWNSRIYTLIAELLLADDNQDIVILGDRTKSDAEPDLDKRVIQPLAKSEGKLFGHNAASRLVYRQGNPLVIEDMQRVNADVAERFVLLAPDDTDQPGGHDVARIRALDTIEAIRGKGRPFSTVVELHSDTLRAHAFYALKMDPRHDAFVTRYEKQLGMDGKPSYLPNVSEGDKANNLTVVNASQIVSRALVQCAVQPFLSLIMHEILSFKGREFFIWQPDPQLWADRFAELGELPVEQRLLGLAKQLNAAVPVGTCQGEEFEFNGKLIGELSDGVAIVMLGDLQSWTGKPQQQTLKAANPVTITPEPIDTSFNVLIVGCNSELDLVIDQLGAYAKQYDQMSLTITIISDKRSLKSVDRDDITLRVISGDHNEWSVLGPLLQEEHFNAILLLGDDQDIDEGEVDARVTLGLVMLRAYSLDPRWAQNLSDSHIVAEVRDPSNRGVLESEELAGDVIVSDEYVSGFIAQVCVDFRLEELFRELLDYGDYELYARPMHTDGTARFIDIAEVATQRGEVAIGVLINEDGITRSLLAPALNSELPNATHMIVIAAE